MLASTPHQTLAMPLALCHYAQLESTCQDRRVNEPRQETLHITFCSTALSWPTLKPTISALSKDVRTLPIVLAVYQSARSFCSTDVSSLSCRPRQGSCVHCHVLELCPEAIAPGCGKSTGSDFTMSAFTFNLMATLHWCEPLPPPCCTVQYKPLQTNELSTHYRHRKTMQSNPNNPTTQCFKTRLALASIKHAPRVYTVPLSCCPE